MERRWEISVAAWLDWPIGCFRLTDAQAARLAGLAPRGAHVEVCRSRAAFLRALPEATHALTWEFKAEWFARAPRLRFVATPSAGREWMPPPETVPPGVEVRHGRFHGRIMAETVIACIFAHARGLFKAAEFNRAGNPWPRTELSPFCSQVAGTRAVILGYGSIGREIGRRLKTLGVEIRGIRRRNIAELRPALRNADWLVLALPSDTGTDNIADASLLAELPPHAVLVNVGRGNAVDEPALVDAIRRERLAAAFLDVVKDEPLKETSPLHPRNLRGIRAKSGGSVADAIHILPHASAFSPQYLDRFLEETFAAAGVWERRA